MCRTLRLLAMFIRVAKKKELGKAKFTMNVMEAFRD